MKISCLYGKKIAGDNGKKRGVILGVEVSGKRIERLICCDDDQKRFCVTAENIISLKGDARFDRAEKAGKENRSLQLGKAVFTQDGVFCGYLEDCRLHGLEITEATVAGKKIPFADLVLGDVCIIKEATQAESAAKDMFIDAVCRTISSPAAGD